MSKPGGVPTREIRKDAKLLFENDEEDASKVDFRNREYARRAFLDVFSDKLKNRKIG